MEFTVIIAKVKAKAAEFLNFVKAEPNRPKVVGGVLLIVLLLGIMSFSSEDKKARPAGKVSAEKVAKPAHTVEEGLAAYNKGDYEAAMKILLPLAERGDARAQGHVGLMYEGGQSVTEDDTGAFEWYQRAAAQGHTASQNSLAAMYYDGRGVEKDNVQAYLWFSVAGAAKGLSAVRADMTSDQVAEAQNLVDAWQPQPETPPAVTETASPDSANASAAAVPASAATDPCVASPSPGAVCADGTVFAGISPDGKMALFTTRCDMGQNWDGAACTGTRSAIAWNNGKEVTTKTETAGKENDGASNTSRLSVLEDAGSPYQAALVCDGLEADGNDDWYLPAMQELKAITKNAAAIGGFDMSSTAQSLYWSSTEDDSSRGAWVLLAQSATEVKAVKKEPLSVRCVRGTPAPENAHAMSATPAGEQMEQPPGEFSAEAQLIIGNIFYKGKKIAKDHKAAVNWWRKAAERGNGLAQLYLGTAYHAGDGVEKDDAQAAKWLRKSMAQGYGDAQLLLYKYGLPLTNEPQKKPEITPEKQKLDVTK